MIVYLIYNMVNNKGYVGKHRGNSISTRWRADLSGGHNQHLENARIKYGWKSFKREILNRCSSSQEMNNLERLWILTLRTYDSEYGYNKTYGGEGEVLTEEGKTKLSKWNKENSPVRGKVWITNGEQNREVPEANIPDGWWRGKTTKGYRNPGTGSRTLESRLKQGESAKEAWKKRRERGDHLVLIAAGKRFTDAMRGKTYEEIYGEERAKVAKAKQSKTRSGRIDFQDSNSLSPVTENALKI